MAGSLDTALRSVAKQVVSTLGTSLDTTITYTLKNKSSYRIETGEQHVSTTTYSNLKVPIEIINSTEEAAREVQEAKLYITPDLIGNNQPSIEDEVSLIFDGSSRVARVINIGTYRGGQTYLFVIRVRF